MPVAKVFSLLRYLAGQREPSNLPALAAALGLTKTTVHRIASQLETLGLIERKLGSRQFTIAPGLLDFAVHVISASVRGSSRHAVLEALAQELGESCSLGISVGYEVMYVDHVASTSPLTLHFRTGQRAPLHATSMGKLYLARMSEAELTDYLASCARERFTRRTLVDAVALRREVERVRAQDFATSESEFVDGVVGAAVSVIGPQNKLYAALALSAPASRLSMAEVRAAVPVLARAAARLGALLGGDTPANPSKRTATRRHETRPEKRTARLHK